VNSTLVSLFEHKAWANVELHAALAAFDAQRYPDRLRAMLQVLDHVHVVDRIFQDHLTGGIATPPFQGTNSEATPGLPALVEAVRATDPGTCSSSRRSAPSA